ncbi:phosphoribosyl pyrophosphokinase [Teratosphaeria nubilosa]|uniref:Ribose-phosphate pyrophosphokinase 1 n=1 Tax=Teratosphaeria nubilosa TaxID=161662 RepID=A0A6G1LGU1_9PEZI|nr:phosphoribosyl pyrophosphokinase [Teratosphaeria nubilosa]
MRQVCVFSGSSHPQLVQSICDRLGQSPSQVALKKFANGETSVEIKTSVRDCNVFIVQSGSSEINDNVMELLIMINACKGGSARSITAVMPYFPYSRQSKKKAHRGAITARMLANLMNVAGVNHVITIDLHASQSQGFFKCPVDNLVAEPLIAKWIKMNIPDWGNAVVVSKNAGGTKRVTSLADNMKLSFGIVTTDQRRPHKSMMNSFVCESVGADGTNDTRALEAEPENAEARIRGTSSKWASTISEHNPARPVHVNGNGVREEHRNQRRPSRPRAVTANPGSASRARLVNGDSEHTFSPLRTSTRLDSIGNEDAVPTNVDESVLHRYPTAPGIEQPPHLDEDGYEDPETEFDRDERARDVVTGRLMQGHIVEDDHDGVVSPTMSVRSGSVQGNGPRGSNSSDDQLPEAMTQSFMSTTSSRFNRRRDGLGGTGDAHESDEEEEEALKDPELEHTVTLVGNVKDKPVLIVDDMIDKAGSWIAAAETVVKRGGATKVYCMATHGLFGGDCLRELDACNEIEAIVVTDAFPIPEEKRQQSKKLVVLDVSGLLAEAIRRNHHGESISALYNYYD